MPFDAVGFEIAIKDATLDALVKAREWLEQPGHWTKRRAWRDRTGMATSNTALVGSTCALGAVSFQLYQHGGIVPGVYSDAAELLENACGAGACVPDFNDRATTTHADVLALFDRAIAARRAALSKAGG